MSRTITISLYSTEKSAPLMMSLSLIRYPPVRNFSDCSTRRGVSRSPSRAGSSPTSINRRRSVSCILAFYLLAAGVLLAAPGRARQSPPPVGPLAQADELYKRREDLASAKQAVALYDQRSTTSFEAAWKLARACYWLATAGPAKERGSARDRGVKAGELAVRLDASKPEGHFWLAAILGEVADNASFLTAWKYPGRIKTELERVLAIDKAWQEGSADRALGEWYFRVPGAFGGDHKQAEEHLRASLQYNATSIASLYFLAEVVADDNKRKEEATTILQQALAAPVDPDWAPEDHQFQQKATALLAKLTKK